MTTIIQDLQFSLRSLLARPAFTIVALVTIALGIGANAAMFSTIDTILLRPLPYPQAEQLVLLWEHHPAIPFDQMPTSPSDFRDWRDQNKVFGEIVAFAPSSMTLNGSGMAERVSAVVATGNMFSLAGVQPLAGRVFGQHDAEADSTPVAVISLGFAERRFGAAAKALGQDITLNGVKHTVLGVMPAGFEFPPSISFQGRMLLMKTDVWTPLRVDPMTDDRGSKSLFTAARMKNSIDVRTAQNDMDVINAGLAKQFPDTNDGITVSVVALHDQVVRNSRPVLLALFAAVGLVLLIACANVANLLLARATGRQREMAIRTALGGTNWRLVRQLLTESLTLSILGGILGVLLALWGIDLLARFGPQDIPRLNEVHVNAAALGFTFLIATVTGILFGLAPALQARRLDVVVALKETSQNVSATASRQRIRSALVVFETALALVLLIGSALLIRSLVRLQSVDPGFNVQNLLTANISLSPADYGDPAQQTRFFERVIEQVRRLPGVQAAALASAIPLTNSLSASDVTAEGQPEPARKESRGVATRVTSPGYFKAMNIQLRAGREFDETDHSGMTRVAVINETMAKQFWPGVDPIGRRVKIGDTKEANPWLTVVGISADARSWSIDRPVEPELYQSFAQNPASRMVLIVKSSTDPIALTAAVRREVAAVDPGQPIYAVQSMEQYLANSFSPSRFRAFLTSLFAALAALLAAVGIYGVMTYFVSERIHEIGIRMALGAQKREVLALVLMQGMKLIGAGIATGLILAFALTRLIRSLLFGIEALDPLTFIAVSISMAFIAAAAIYIPARRAMRVDPIVALRYE